MMELTAKEISNKISMLYYNNRGKKQRDVKKLNSFLNSRWKLIETTKKKDEEIDDGDKNTSKGVSGPKPA